MTAQVVIDLSAVDFCDEGSAGVIGLPGDDDEDKIVRRLVSVADEFGDWQIIDPMTHCLDCCSKIRCRYKRKNWYKIHFQNLVKGIHRGQCKCATVERRNRAFWINEKDNAAKWLPASTVRSYETKERKNGNQAGIVKEQMNEADEK
jgi:hypothetical protein